MTEPKTRTPDLIQMRVLPNGRWHEPAVTKTEKTVQERVDYLMRVYPGVYEVRYLFVADPN